METAVAVFGTFFVLFTILYAVLTNNKAIGALIQLGDVQRRREVHQQIREIKEKGATSDLVTKKVTTTTERLSFTIGVVNACFTCFLLGAFPTHFYLWYSPKAITLTFARWNDFRKRKQHYLLYDFCYWANGLTLVYIWFFPTNPLLFQIVFLCANGPLAWSILAFNQSLVFHKWQQIVSVFIHVSPMMLTYGLRWNYDPHFAICHDFPECDTVSTMGMVWNTMTKFYLWWIVFYYLWIFVCLGNYLTSKSFTTLYDRVAGAQMKFLFSKEGVLSESHHLTKKAIYMGTHVLFGFLTMLVATIWWKYQWAHILFLITICSMSAYNASQHYDYQFKTEIEVAANNVPAAQAAKSARSQ